jgi:hypothetical protein
MATSDGKVDLWLDIPKDDFEMMTLAAWWKGISIDELVGIALRAQYKKLKGKAFHRATATCRTSCRKRRKNEQGSQAGNENA